MISIIKVTKDKEIGSVYVLEGEGKVLPLSFTVLEIESKNLVFTVNQITKFVPNPEPRDYYLTEKRCPWRELEANKSKNSNMGGKFFIKKTSMVQSSGWEHTWKMRTKPYKPLQA